MPEQKRVYTTWQSETLLFVDSSCSFIFFLHTIAIPSVTNAEHQFRSNLASFYKEERFGDESYQQDFASQDGSGHSTFPPIFPLDEQGNGWSGQAYNEAISQLNNLRSSPRDNLSKFGITALQAFALFASDQDESAVELFHEVRYLEDLDIVSLKAGNYKDEYSLALLMMGYAVYGEAKTFFL